MNARASLVAIPSAIVTGRVDAIAQEHVDEVIDGVNPEARAREPRVAVSSPGNLLRHRRLVRIRHVRTVKTEAAAASG